MTAAKAIVTHDTWAALEAWIADCRARGVWATPCRACGGWFEQQRLGLGVGKAGRRAVICGARICVKWARWQNKYGRAPPAWLCMKWKEEG